MFARVLSLFSLFTTRLRRCSDSAQLVWALNSNTFSWPAIVITCMFVGMVFWRTGYIPIASGGDDVWFSESGYWYLQEGVLRRPMHKNALLSDLRDFLPPTPSLAQAISFAALGVNQFSMAIGPSIIVSLLVISIMVFGYYLRVPATIAACSGIAAFAIPESFQRAIQARYDIYVAFFTVLSIMFLNLGRARRYLLSYLASGALLGLSIISYYPFAIIAVILLVPMMKWYLFKEITLVEFCAFVSGGMLVGALFLAWIGQDFYWMLKYLSAAGESYGAAGRMLRIAQHRGDVPWWMILLVIINGATVARLWRSSGCRTDLALATCTAALACGLIMLGTSHALLPVMAALSVLSVLLVLSLDLRPPALLLSTGALVPAAAVALVGATYSALVLGSQDGRHIEPFGSQLRAAINPDGLVLVDNPGWLPLREYVPRNKLVHIAGYSPDASRADVSALFFDINASAQISSVAIVPGTQDRLAAFPAIVSFLHRADVEGPIVVGPAMPYQLELYRKKR
jgi:hypothetical protein